MKELHNPRKKIQASDSFIVRATKQNGEDKWVKHIIPGRKGFVLEDFDSLGKEKEEMLRRD